MTGLDDDTHELDQVTSEPQQRIGLQVSEMELEVAECQASESTSEVATNQYTNEELRNLTSKSSVEVVLEILKNLVNDVVTSPKADSPHVPKLINPKPKIYSCEKC